MCAKWVESILYQDADLKMTLSTDHITGGNGPRFVMHPIEFVTVFAGGTNQAFAL